MNRYKIEAGSLYYKNELVAAFIPKINGIDVLHDCVTDVYTYKYHVSVETQDSATNAGKKYLNFCKISLFISIGRNVQVLICCRSGRKDY